MPLISRLMVPESPVWLLHRGKTDRAAAAQRRLEANKKFTDTHRISFARLQSTIARDFAVALSVMVSGVGTVLGEE